MGKCMYTFENVRKITLEKISIQKGFLSSRFDLQLGRLII